MVRFGPGPRPEVTVWYMLHTVYAALVVSCTHRMLQPVVNASSWHGEIQRDDLTLSAALIVELWIRKREMGEEDGNDMDTSRYETSGVLLA